MAKQEIEMKLQCKDGDIAVVTWDYLGCASNIGRLVQASLSAGR